MDLHLAALLLSAKAGEDAVEAVRILDHLLGLTPEAEPLTLISDGHRDYARAIRQHPGCGRIRHLAFPNPRRGPKGSRRSSEAVDRDSAMFPVDLLHKISGVLFILLGLLALLRLANL